MEEIKNNNAIFEEPLLEVVHLTEKDIITTNGESYDDPDQETEIIRY